jgi:hypothetical protein
LVDSVCAVTSRPSSNRLLTRSSDDVLRHHGQPDQEVHPAPLEIYVDDDWKLTFHGLQQFYVKLEEAQKSCKLNDLLDALEFNQGRLLKLPCLFVNR